MSLKMTTAQVVETSVTVTNSSFQNYTHPDDHTTHDYLQRLKTLLVLSGNTTMFAVDGSGLVTTLSTFDFETVKSYLLVLRAH